MFIERKKYIYLGDIGVSMYEIGQPQCHKCIKRQKVNHNFLSFCTPMTLALQYHPNLSHTLIDLETKIDLSLSYIVAVKCLMRQ